MLVFATSLSDLDLAATAEHTLLASGFVSVRVLFVKLAVLAELRSPTRPLTSLFEITKRIEPNGGEDVPARSCIARHERNYRQQDTWLASGVGYSASADGSGLLDRDCRAVGVCHSVSD
jgi:hypothetical protein